MFGVIEMNKKNNLCLSWSRTRDACLHFSTLVMSRMRSDDMIASRLPFQFIAQIVFMPARIVYFYYFFRFWNQFDR